MFINLSDQNNQMFNKKMPVTTSPTNSHSAYKNPKLMASLFLSPSSKPTYSGSCIPKSRVDVGFRPPKFLQTKKVDVVNRDLISILPTSTQKNTFDYSDHFKKLKHSPISRNITHKTSVKRVASPIINEARSSSKLKDTISTNVADTPELSNVPSSPTLFSSRINMRKQQSLTPPLNHLTMRKFRSLDESKDLTIDQFKMVRRLGEGKFGKVYMAEDKITGMIFAIKIMEKEKVLKENLLEQLIRELKIQAFLDHPNLVKLYGVTHDKDFIYVVMELGADGQLFELMQQKTLCQETTSFVMKSLLSGVGFMHSKSIIHRDIKPQNIVLIHGSVKICDFGWAVQRKSQLRSTLCGTPLYLSPQMLNGHQYDQKIDIWAIGVLAYQMLLGESPFQITEKQHLHRIVTHKVLYPQNPEIPSISLDFKNFIEDILTKNPRQRPTSAELLKKKFISYFNEVQTCSELCI